MLECTICKESLYKTTDDTRDLAAAIDLALRSALEVNDKESARFYMEYIEIFKRTKYSNDKLPYG